MGQREGDLTGPALASGPGPGAARPPDAFPALPAWAACSPTGQDQVGSETPVAQRPRTESEGLHRPCPQAQGRHCPHRLCPLGSTPSTGGGLALHLTGSCSHSQSRPAAWREGPGAQTRPTEPTCCSQCAQLRPTREDTDGTGLGPKVTVGLSEQVCDPRIQQGQEGPGWSFKFRSGRQTGWMERDGEHPAQWAAASHQAAGPRIHPLLPRTTLASTKPHPSHSLSTGPSEAVRSSKNRLHSHTLVDARQAGPRL